MATLTPTLTLASTDAHSDDISLSVTKELTITAPSAGVTRVATDDNALGDGAGVLITEAAATGTTFIYVKHLGILSSDGTTSCHASNDFITLLNADGDFSIAKLQPEEFCFLPLSPFDGSDGGVEAGGLKVVAASAAVMIEYGYWTKG